MRKLGRFKPMWLALPVVAAVAVVMAAALPAMTTRGADHLDAPLVQQDGRLDINDVYAFQSPSDPNNTVMIMTVNPVAGVANPTTLHPDGIYDFLIQNSGDLKQDVRYSFRFSKPNSKDQQQVTILGPGIKKKGKTGEDISLPGGGMAHVGVFDDPFFFDLAAFQNGLNFCPGGTGTDFFAGLNVTGIVLEVPSYTLGGDNIGVWGRTMYKGIQVDRMGRPAINTVLIPDDLSKDLFNISHPRRDAQNWRDEVIGTLLGLGNDQATSESLADILLPDILTIDTSSNAGFLNGRQLADDVIDAELALITGGAVSTDCVDSNDVTFPGTFPYLAAAH